MPDLAPQIVDIPLGLGVNEKADPNLLAPPALAVIENGVFSKTGRVEKRFGYQALVTTGLPSGQLQQHSLFRNDDALLCLTVANSVYRLAEAHGTGRWSAPATLTAGETSPAMAVETHAEGVYSATGAAAFEIVNTDVATANGMVAYAWIEGTFGLSGAVRVLVQDATSGVTVLGPTPLTSAAAQYEYVRIVRSSATDFAVVASELGGANVYAWRLDMSGSGPWAWSAATTLSTIHTSGTPIDVCASASSNHFYTAFDVTTPGTRIERWTPALVTANSLTIASRSQAAVAVFSNPVDSRVYTAHAATATAIAFTIRSADLSVNHAGPTTMLALIGSGCTKAAWVQTDLAGVTGARLVWSEGGDASDSQSLRARTTSQAGALQSDSVIAYHLAPAGKPFFQDNKAIIPARYAPPATQVVQPTGFLLRVYGSTASNAMKFGVLSRFLSDRIRTDLTHVVSPASNVWIGAMSTIGSSPAVDGFFASQTIERVEWTFRAGAVPWAEHRGVTYIAAGQLWAYDGTNVQEVCPQWSPEQPTVTMAGSGGSIPAGVHQWCVVWEWEDARGTLHRSAPSPVRQQTAAANDRADVVFPDLTLRARDGTFLPPVRAALYRTKVAGTVFFLAQRGSPTATTPNGMVTMSDGLSDTALGEVLYTTGGILPNDPPPPPLDLVITKERMFVLDGEDRTRVRYSKLLKSTIAPEFSAALELTIPRGDGTALAVLDDALIAFTAREVYGFFGDGPTDAGALDSFSRGTLIPGDQGCTERTSVVQCSAGVLFRGARGIFLLDRSRNISYIGAPVEDTLGSNAILRGVHVEERSEVRFLLSDGAVLVWNYLFQGWSTFTGFGSMVDACLYEDLYTTMQSAATPAFMHEDPSTWFDPGDTYVPLRIRTGWIHIASRQGYQRARRVFVLGDALDLHQLSVQFGYDREAAFTTPVLVNVAAPESPMQRRYHLARQKCQAFRVEISDSETSSVKGRGFSLSGLTCEIGALRGGPRLIDARSG